MSYSWRNLAMTDAEQTSRPSDVHDMLAKLALGAMMSISPEAASADPLDPVSEPEARAVTVSTQGSGLPVPPESSRASLRDYGPARPGMGTPPTTIDPGHVSVEIGLADWQRDDQPGVRADTLLTGSTTLRLGVGNSTEVFASWVGFGRVRVRDTDTGEVDEATRAGDVAIGLKRNLRHPDGSGLSIAAQPFVVLPVGRDPVGAGDWGAGVVFPASYAVSQTVGLQLTPEIDAATNGGGHGRHLAYSLVGGVGVQVAKPLQITVEMAGQRDLDPEGHTTRVFAGVSFGWKVSNSVQLDVGGTLGLNPDTPDHRLYAGISRRF